MPVPEGAALPPQGAWRPHSLGQDLYGIIHRESGQLAIHLKFNRLHVMGVGHRGWLWLLVGQRGRGSLHVLLARRFWSDHTGWRVLVVKSSHVVLDAGQTAVHLTTGGVRTLVGWLGHTAVVQKLVHVVAKSQPRHGGGGVWVSLDVK